MRYDGIKRVSCAAVCRAGLAGFFVLAAASACSSSTPTGIACTAVYVYGIALTVQNAATGAPVTDSASVRISDGNYVETYGYLGASGQPGAGTITAAGERAGTYSISIRKIGYAPFDTSGITVTKDACHVHPVAVVAKLQLAPPAALRAMAPM